jgi:hypothetical protein
MPFIYLALALYPFYIYLEGEYLENGRELI